MQEQMGSGRATVAESFLERDVKAKDAAHAAGTAAAQPLLGGKSVALEVPDYDDPYLTFLWYQGFGQAIVNRGRDIGGLNFKASALIADGKSVAPKEKKRDKGEETRPPSGKVSW